MKLESLDGRLVELVVTSYQFAGARSTSHLPDWDANWLIIDGKVWDGDQSWTFRDPCMTTWEAQELGSWLRSLTNADRVSVATAQSEELRLSLTEPNMMFTLHQATQGIIRLDVYFDAESRPPSGSNDDDQGLGHRVP